MNAAIVTIAALAAFAAIVILATHCAEPDIARHVQIALREQADEQPTCTDAEADAEWADLLAPFDLTPEQVRADWEAQNAANEAEVARFRAELDDFKGVAS